MAFLNHAIGVRQRNRPRHSSATVAVANGKGYKPLSKQQVDNRKVSLQILCCVLLISCWTLCNTSGLCSAKRWSYLRRMSSGLGFQYNRVVYLNNHEFATKKHREIQTTDDLHPSANTEDKTTVEQSDCVPMADWQTRSFPQCNNMHELDMRQGLHDKALSFLGRGWFRTTWKWQSDNETVVIKTLRTEREYMKEYYELHRRDAVAMERLTSSPFVVDVYGYCGQSAINEFANFDVPGVASLEDLDKRMRGQYSRSALIVKLRLAAAISQGLADIHYGGDYKTSRPVMVHYDLNPRNIAMFKGGLPKINDFNIAEFLQYNPRTNETCPFESRIHTPWWRAPEEVVEDGKTRWIDHSADLYSLGNLLFHILTTHAPRGKMIDSRAKEVSAKIASGAKPILMEPFHSSKDPIVLAFRVAMDMCFEPHPRKRQDARVVAKVLKDALQDAMDNR